MGIGKAEVLSGLTAACFLILIGLAVLDGITSSEMIQIGIQVVGTFLAMMTLATERTIRMAEVRVKEGDLGIRQQEAERAKDEWQRKQDVKRAKIRGRLLTWLASGPDAGLPVDADMLVRLRAETAGQTELLEAYPPLAHLVAELDEAIQWDTTLGSATHEHIAKKVRKMEKGLRPK